MAGLQTDLDVQSSKLEQAKLDTALTLREVRSGLINMKYSMEEKKMVVEQSKYDPAVIHVHPSICRSPRT